MKIKILAIFLLSAMAASAQTHIRSGKPIYSVANNKPVATFQVDISSAGSYYISCWLQGVKHSDGSCSSYSLEVQGTYYSGTVMYGGGDWGPTNTIWAYLSAGTHTITVTGSSLSDVPNVEFVNLCTAPMSVDRTRYTLMKSHNLPSPPSGSGYATSFNYNETGSQTTPPITFTAQRDMAVYYTFRRLEYYTAGQTVNVSVDSIHSNGTDKLISIFPYNENMVSGNTWFSTTSLSAEVVTSGFYYVMVSPISSTVYGTCWLNIDGTRYFEDVPLNCCVKTLSSSFATSTYQCFAISDNGDPMCFVLSPTGVLVSYNDDRGYDTTVSDFDWGLNSRVLAQMGSGYMHFTTLFNSYPLTDYTAVADIYSGLRNGYTPYGIGLSIIYPNYKQSDIMASGGVSGDYNCLAWAWGDWLSNPYFNAQLNQSGVLAAMDAQSAVHGYTRTGATADNSLIDVYTYNGWITHVAVKEKTHWFAAGYDWESKLGIPDNIREEVEESGIGIYIPDFERVFHPRYALEGSFAGQVTYHFIKIPSALSNQVQFPDEVRTIENAELTDEEWNIIKQGEADVTTEIKKKFNSLVSTCLEECFGISFLCLQQYEDLPHYAELSKFCTDERSLMFTLCRLAANGSTLATKLLYDATDREFGHISKSIYEDNIKHQYTDDGKYIVRSARTDVIRYIKGIFSNGVKNVINSSNTFSSDSKFSITHSGLALTVKFNIDKDALITVAYCNPNRSVMQNAINCKQMQAGNQEVSFEVPEPGIYAVAVIINGSIYEKKVILQ